MLNLTNIATQPEIVASLGKRFREYRMRMNLTRKEASELTTIGQTTLYKFETGQMTDISLVTLLKLLRLLGMEQNWEKLLPELPESPYLYIKDKKRQRIRHPKS